METRPIIINTIYQKMALYVKLFLGPDTIEDSELELGKNIRILSTYINTLTTSSSRSVGDSFRRQLLDVASLSLHINSQLNPSLTWEEHINKALSIVNELTNNDGFFQFDIPSLFERWINIAFNFYKDMELYQKLRQEILYLIAARSIILSSIIIGQEAA